VYILVARWNQTELLAIFSYGDIEFSQTVATNNAAYSWVKTIRNHGYSSFHSGSARDCAEAITNSSNNLDFSQIVFKNDDIKNEQFIVLLGTGH